MSETNTVRIYMSTQVVTLHPDMDILEAVQILADRGIPGAPVVDDLGNIVGLLAEKDCLEAVLKATYHEEWGGRVAEYMQTRVRTIDAGLGIIDAAQLFVETSLRGFPVVDNQRIVGQLNRSDLLKALIRLSRDSASKSAGS
jgi:predicted transcriptional regulator